MKKQLVAGAMALALGMGITTGAMAFNQGDRGLHSERFEGVRGFGGWHDGEWGGRRYGHHYEDDYAAGRGLSGAGAGTYCPAFSRCGAGFPD